jgi:hypothetical protein
VSDPSGKENDAVDHHVGADDAADEAGEQPGEQRVPHEFELENREKSFHAFLSVIFTPTLWRGAYRIHLS